VWPSSRSPQPQGCIGPEGHHQGEGDASWLNLDVLAYLDPDISVTVIENGRAIKKEKPQPPKRLVNIVRCKNPRCISSIEEECDQIFELSSNGKYRCIYCEQELQVKPE